MEVCVTGIGGEYKSMTICLIGLNRLADVAGSTWAYFALGTASTNTTSGMTDLTSTITPRRVITTAVTINNTCSLVGFLQPSQNNSASSVVEIAFFDASTANNMLFRSVASTATWTEFVKDSTKSALIVCDLTISA